MRTTSASSVLSVPLRRPLPERRRRLHRRRGYLFVMGRIDDVINVAGHRLSTGAMEEVVAPHADVAECAVFGVADDLKGQVPGWPRRPQGRRQPTSWGRSNPSSSPGTVPDRGGGVVQGEPSPCCPLPKTAASGKILRSSPCAASPMANRSPCHRLSTDPAALATRLSQDLNLGATGSGGSRTAGACIPTRLGGGVVARCLACCFDGPPGSFRPVPPGRRGSLNASPGSAIVSRQTRVPGADHAQPP